MKWNWGCDVGLKTSKNDTSRRKAGNLPIMMSWNLDKSERTGTNTTNVELKANASNWGCFKERMRGLFGHRIISIELFSYKVIKILKVLSVCSYDVNDNDMSRNHDINTISSPLFLPP